MKDGVTPSNIQEIGAQTEASENEGQEDGTAWRRSPPTVYGFHG